MHVSICGGGVIGASIAYFLSCRGVRATVIEGTGLACAASGKSGGFLARDWCDGSPLAPLARRSFALHAGLPQRITGEWGYRRLDTYGGVAGFGRRRSDYNLEWLSDIDKVTRTQMEFEETLAIGPEGHLIVDAGDHVAEMRRRQVLLRDGLEVEYVQGFLGVRDQIVQLARRPGHRIGEPRRRGYVLRESWRTDIRQQRAGGHELKETTATSDLIDLWQ